MQACEVITTRSNNLLRLVVFEFDMEAALDADLHSDVLVLLGELPEGVDCELHLVCLVADAAADCDPQHVTQTYVRARVTLVRLLHLSELERQRRVRTQLAGPRELAHQRDELVSSASVRI